MTTRDSYIHGTDPAEQARLSLLNDLLNDRCLAQLALRGGERILDVGAGLGQLTRAMARAAGVAAIGVERSAEQLAGARARALEAGEAALVDFRAGEAGALPLAPAELGTFDVVHARFLLEHVADPLQVVQGMVRAARPGGRVVLCDDDHDLLRLHPEPPGVRAAWDAFIRSYDRNGNDPFVGRRLPALLHAAGASPRQITWVFFGACAGDPTFPHYVANLAHNLLGAAASIAATGALDQPALEAAVRALEVWGQRPDAAIWYGMAWAEGVKPA